MFKRVTLFPFLFVLYLVITPLFNSLGEIDPSQALRPLAFLLVVAAVLLVLFAWIFRNWHYAGYLVFLGLVFFFLYGHLSRVLQGWLPFDAETTRIILLVVWGGLTLALAFKWIWKRFGGKKVTAALNLYVGILLLIELGSGTVKFIQNPISFARQEPAAPETFVKLDCQDTPDIYYIIVDAYGRQDVLRSIYGVDNAPFLDFLKNKGFYIAKQSHPNYTQSVFSIPSGLNFSYLESEPVNANATEYFTNLVTNNRLMATLKQCGYKTVAFESGFYFTNHPQVDVFLSSGSWLSEFEGLLLADSPLDFLSALTKQKPPEHSYEAHRQRVLFTFNQLKNLPRMAGPKMVFAHIVSPHPPFVFDAQGNPIQPKRAYSLSDGDDYKGTWEEYRAGYAGQVQFVDSMLEETVTTILKRSKKPPIIIIQGDHGPGGSLNWSSPERSCLWERASILNAYYLPNGGMDLLYPEITPVNSFRLVLDYYLGADLELLPDRTYFTSHRLIRQIIDITDERGSKKNCP